MPIVCLRQVLRLASLPYWGVISTRNLAYRLGWKKSFRSRLKVISIGNLSVGGTGKTPTVAWLAQWLRERELRVAILSRGYGQLDSGQNDEALELELQLPDVPHLQHWDRVASANLADEELDMQVLLLDDGFQHRRLARDLDIVLIDASESNLTLRLLPGGLLREPFSSLRRAQVVIFTRCDQATPEVIHALLHRVLRHNRQITIAHASHRPTRVDVFPSDSVSLEALKGKRALAFCAIGSPNSFFATLTSLGVTLVDQRTWPDHHAYSADDVQQLIAWTEQKPNIDWVLCTRKDWVKLQMSKIGQVRLGALVVELEVIEGREELEQQLTALVASCD
ncbi:MAG: tetraacyldisaccharide 4'-kinase [Planctomycetales bacterium 12-60-4]|nr:MAG: tetraacyldisaccharide 4'-kinase [Planctomycetales bacterium 12-60-4]